MTHPHDPLIAAREEMRRRLWKAEEAGDWPRALLLSPLTTVADHAARIANGFEAFYRADKSDPLVGGALAVRCEAFKAYAKHVKTPDDSTGVLESVDVLCLLVSTLEEKITSSLWCLARTGALYQSTAGELREATGVLATWVNHLVTTAVPDPEDW